MLRFTPALVVLGTLPSTALALPLPLAETVAMGSPALRVDVEISASDEGVTLRARAGARDAQATLSVAGIDDAAIERVELAGGDAVAIVRGTGGGRSVAAIVAVRRGAPAIVWSGRTDLHGDPGERTASRVELADRTGDGAADVVVGTVREGAAICGQQDTLLSPRAWDPGRGELRPVVLSRVAAGAEVPVTATRESPGPGGAPLVRALTAIAASSTSGRAEDDPSATAAPSSLIDGRVETFWAEGRGGPGAQEFAVLRWGARLPIRAFAVTPSPTGEAARRLGRPRRFFLVGDGGARLAVTVPDDPLAHPGERYWIVPPEPVAWSCVALVLDAAHAPAGIAPAAVHAGLAELEAYTELDWGAGIEGLVSLLVEGGAGGDEAARLLAALEPPEAAQSVATAWDRLDPVGRRRAVRVFAAAARRGHAPGAASLEMAASDPTEEVSTAAMEALGTLGPDAGAALARLVALPPPLGDRAVRPLLRHPAQTTVAALLEAIGAEGGSERAVLREALPRAVGRGEAGRAAVARWLETGPPVAARASAALGLASHSESRELSAPIVRALIEEEMRFEDRWRVVRAAAEAAPDARVDAWLGDVAGGAEEWMLRAAAIAALGRRGSDRRGPVARAALRDEYPRVRVAAIEQLDTLDADDEALAERASRDSWPMVRAAAVEALFDRPAGRDAVRAALDDRSARVRHAGLTALTRGGDRAVLPLVRARLEDEEEWPQVTLAALRWVSELCVEDAGESVLAVVRRGIRPDAWAPDVDVAAVAADLAMRLGGPTARDVQTLVARADFPESVRLVVERRRANPVASCADASRP